VYPFDDVFLAANHNADRCLRFIASAVEHGKLHLEGLKEGASESNVNWLHDPCEPLNRKGDTAPSFRNGQQDALGSVLPRVFCWTYAISVLSILSTYAR
jgi:hypothetical protein